jgi:DNA-binding transcriptional LysR family regulator
MYSGLNSSGSPVCTHALCTPWVNCRGRAVTPTTCLDLLPPGETVDASLSRLICAIASSFSDAQHVARAEGGITVASSSHASARSSGEGGIAVWLTPRFLAAARSLGKSLARRIVSPCRYRSTCGVVVQDQACRDRISAHDGLKHLHTLNMQC